MDLSPPSAILSRSCICLHGKFPGTRGAFAFSSRLLKIEHASSNACHVRNGFFRRAGCFFTCAHRPPQAVTQVSRARGALLLIIPQVPQNRACVLQCASCPKRFYFRATGWFLACAHRPLQAVTQVSRARGALLLIIPQVPQNRACVLQGRYVRNDFSGPRGALLLALIGRFKQ